MAVTMSIILRAVIFCGVSITKLTLSVPAPGWQSAQSRPRSAEMTPMAPIKSSTVRALRAGVVTFLNVSPAFFCLVATCADAGPTSPTPASTTAVTMAAAASAAPDTFNLIPILIIDYLSRSDLQFLPGSLLRAAVVCRSGKQLTAVGQLDVSCVGKIGAILRHITVHIDHVADLHRTSGPSAARQTVGASQLEFPVCHRALVVFHVHVKPGMGVHPLDLRHRTGEGDRLGIVILRRERMMREHGHRGRKQTERCDPQTKPGFHRKTSKTWIAGRAAFGKNTWTRRTPVYMTPCRHFNEAC